jgi:hypothetical protein
MGRLMTIICLVPNMLLAQAVPRSETDPRVKTLAARAAEAKANGLSEVTFSTPEQTPVFSTSLLDSSSRFSVVVGRLSAKQALVSDRRIMTWYRLDVDYVLTDHASPFDTFELNSIPASERPTRLLPVEASQLLLIQPGGRATIQGISIVERETGGKPLQLNQPFLFILETSIDHQLARLPFGLAGVFEIQPDGDSLRPMTSLSREIPDDVKSSYSDSLSLIRRKVPGR